jgi:hypothetical protein
MPCTAAREFQDTRPSCQVCSGRNPRVRSSAEDRAQRAPVLCFECFRSDRGRPEAQLLAEESSAAPRSPFNVAAALSARQIAHRRAMLGHLSSAGR